MNQKIIIYMVVKNVSKKLELFTNVVTQASKVSKDFFIVNHGSDDNTIEIINNISTDLDLKLELINEDFVWTMDDMKWKYYKVLKEKYWKNRNFIFILDWDEVLDYKLINEINSLNFEKDVYMININTYLIKKVIDINHFQPRFFEINSVEIDSFSKFHNLFNIKSKNIKKLNWILHHYSYDSIQNLINKNIYYSKNEAMDLFEKNKNINNFMIFLKFLFEGTLYFLYTLFYHFNFLTLEWWLYSINWYSYKFYKYLFYLELKIWK